jgi:hypothetical protein
MKGLLLDIIILDKKTRLIKLLKIVLTLSLVENLLQGYRTYIVNSSVAFISTYRNKKRSGGSMVTFEKLVIDKKYDRPELSILWGYKDWHAIGRGIVTPKGDNKIILFVTKIKQESVTQYQDFFENDLLHMEGERNHHNDLRLQKSSFSDDEVFLFYRERHHMPFTFCGQVFLVDCKINNGEMYSKFIFRKFQNVVVATN